MRNGRRPHRKFVIESYDRGEIVICDLGTARVEMRDPENRPARIVDSFHGDDLKKALRYLSEKHAGIFRGGG